MTIFRGGLLGAMLFSCAAALPGQKSHSTDAKGNTLSAKAARVLTGQESSVARLCFSPDGKVLSCVYGTQTDYWDTIGWKKTWSAETSYSPVEGRKKLLVVTHDGKYCVTQAKEGVLQFGKARTGRVLRSFPGKHAPFQSGMFSDDQSVVILGRKADADRVIAFFRADSGKLIWQVRFRLDDSPGNGELSPDGQFLAWVNRKGSIRLVEVATNKTLRFLVPPEWAGDDELILSNRHVFSPCGRYLALATRVTWQKAGGTLHVWEVVTGKTRARINLPDGEVGVAFDCLAFSPDGRALAYGQVSEKEIVLWEVASGKQRGRLAGHKTGVCELTFSPDGKLLAAGHGDGTVRIWDLTSPPRAAALTASELDGCWKSLADADAMRADRAIRTLVGVPRQALPLLKEQLVPAKGPDPDRLRKLVGDLASEKYSVRQQATKALAAFRELAEPYLNEALQGKPTLEVRQRVEQLLKKVRWPDLSAEGLREVRAVEILERIGTPEARAVLEGVTRGAPGARLTEEAREALLFLARLSGR